MFDLIGTKLKSSFEEIGTMAKVVSSVVSVLVAMGGAWIWLDARYAHAEEVAPAYARASDVVQIKKQIQCVSDGQRKKYLEDEVFKFEVTPMSKHTQTEIAIYNRYKQELFELRRKMTDCPQ